MIGLVLALLGGFSFSISNIFVRKGVHRSGEAFSLIPYSLFFGTVIFGLALFFSGGAGELASLSWRGVSLLGGAGVIHFILGRIFAYNSIRLIGANRAAPLFTVAILFATTFGILFLGEPFKIIRMLAVLVIFGGVILISTSGGSEKAGLPGGSLAKGVLLALGGALSWGTSPLLVKMGLQEISSPWAATFVSYTAASIIIGLSLFHSGNRGKLQRLDRTSLIFILIVSIAGSIGQILRYSAINYSPISVVEPLLGSANTLFIFPLSFLINREIEAFNVKIIMGAISIVAGVFLIFWMA